MSIVTDLEKSLVKLNNTSYDSVDKLMKKVAKDNDISATELHHKFKAKHNMIPDDWIKKQMNEGTLHNWFGKSKSKDGKPGWVQSDGSPCANEPGEKGTPKCYSSRRLAGLKKSEEGKSKIRSADARKSRQDPGQQSKSGGAKPTMVRTFKDPKDYKKHKSGDYKSEGYEMQEAKDQKGSGSGTKDACYSKVKSRYSVWPSAYASGALVKCRKVGAANWGNSTKKEEFEGFYDLPAFTETQIAAMKYAGIEVEVIDEACWKGYEKKGMKTMFGKRYPNCVKKEEVEVVDEKTRVFERLANSSSVKEESIDEAVRVNENGNVYLVSFTWRAKFMMMKMFFPEVKKPTRQEVSAALEKVYPGCMVQRFDLAPRQPGEPLIMVDGYQGGSAAKPGPDKNYVKPMGEGYAPGDVDQKVDALTNIDIPKKERDSARDRLLAKAKAKREKMKKEGFEMEEGAAWTKKSGKNSSGGLNEKGRKSYERDNPGSDLKAPSKKPGNKRRASFCARMKGMKKKLTSAKTANDPDSRINKSLRAWNC